MADIYLMLCVLRQVQLSFFPVSYFLLIFSWFPVSPASFAIVVAIAEPYRGQPERAESL
ncbi:hypothetical protein I5445_06960 [Citrobacter farmeri]|uniref:hypothetical protein n=1 Tax=Citrobacter farmeri TaxID=67824 RepID=UPI0019047261|nr:hypothetical protein [Citrobacter farmeri]EKV7297400.1 hypothetical protein [Citrobacter farmeri]MBJ8744110.1 hypothetical protein [Citrobacter farmeri]MBJ8758075.1 hypothetical protein [Citrobacter farmeri]MBJ9017660.1 hypothetical protein [Citrobacter farmeri]